MRYTTIIDLRELPVLYKNANIRLVYFHLVLKSGYHDNDRDQVNSSLRSLAWEIGITVSALRNALDRLEAAQMIKRTPQCIYVRKWLPEQPITPRAKKKIQAETTATITRLIDDNEEYQKRLAEEARRRRAAADTVDEKFIKTYEEYNANALAGTATMIQKAFLESKAERYIEEKKKQSKITQKQ